MSSFYSFTFFSFLTLNLDVRLKSLESLFLGLWFRHKNNPKWSLDDRVMPVWNLSTCVENKSTQANFWPLERSVQVTEILGAFFHYSSQALTTRAVCSKSATLKSLFGPNFSLFLFHFSSLPLLHTQNPRPPNLDFIYFSSRIHHRSCIKGEEQLKINILTDCIAISSKLSLGFHLLASILEVGLLLTWYIYVLGYICDIFLDIITCELIFVNQSGFDELKRGYTPCFGQIMVYYSWLLLTF